MNNEPVAWMELYKGEFNNLYKNWFDCKDKGEWSAIPLYTHPVNPYQSITNTKIEPTVVSYTQPVKELTREDRLKLIGTLKWAEDLLREAGHDEAVDEVQDCLMILRKVQE